MRNSLNLVVGSLIFVFLQMFAAPRMAFGEVAPDFMLVLVVYFAVHRKSETGAVAGFIIGLFQDLFNPELLGLNALTKSIVGFGIGYVGQKTERDNVPVLAALIAAAALANDFVYLLFFTGLHLGKFFMLFVTVSIPSAIYTAVIGIAVYKVVDTLGSKAGRSFGKARP